MLLPMADILSDSTPPAFFDDDGTVDQRKCRLLGPTALVSLIPIFARRVRLNGSSLQFA